jgi:hypothetical protein
MRDVDMVTLEHLAFDSHLRQLRACLRYSSWLRTRKYRKYVPAATLISRDRRHDLHFRLVQRNQFNAF